VRGREPHRAGSPLSSSPPPPLLIVVEELPARSPLLSGGVAGRRGRGGVARVVQSKVRSSSSVSFLEFGVMPNPSMSQVLTSGARGDCLVLLLLVMFRWSEIAASGGCEAPALLNKLDLRSDLLDLASSLHLSADLRGGERRVGGGELDTATWSTSSTAHRRPTAAIPSIQIAEGRLLRDLAALSASTLHQPPGQRAKWEAPQQLHRGIHRRPRPKWFRPRRRRRRLRCEASICARWRRTVLHSYSRVLFPFSEGLVLVWFFVKVLDVICSPTDEI
jgi:hypothetical protein